MTSSQSTDESSERASTTDARRQTVAFGDDVRRRRLNTRQRTFVTGVAAMVVLVGLTCIWRVLSKPSQRRPVPDMRWTSTRDDTGVLRVYVYAFRVSPGCSRLYVERPRLEGAWSGWSDAILLDRSQNPINEVVLLFRSERVPVDLALHLWMQRNLPQTQLSDLAQDVLKKIAAVDDEQLREWADHRGPVFDESGRFAEELKRAEPGRFPSQGGRP